MKYNFLPIIVKCNSWAAPTACPVLCVNRSVLTAWVHLESVKVSCGIRTQGIWSLLIPSAHVTKRPPHTFSSLLKSPALPHQASLMSELMSSCSLPHWETRPSHKKARECPQIPQNHLHLCVSTGFICFPSGHTVSVVTWSHLLSPSRPASEIF
jgi:hypothetical protein